MSSGNVAEDLEQCSGEGTVFARDPDDARTRVPKREPLGRRGARARDDEPWLHDKQLSNEKRTRKTERCPQHERVRATLAELEEGPHGRRCVRDLGPVGQPLEQRIGKRTNGEHRRPFAREGFWQRKASPTEERDEVRTSEAQLPSFAFLVDQAALFGPGVHRLQVDRAEPRDIRSSVMTTVLHGRGGVDSAAGLLSGTNLPARYT